MKDGADSVEPQALLQESRRLRVDAAILTVRADVTGSAESQLVFLVQFPTQRRGLLLEWLRN
eukprot:11078448-Prorocentrum_lima.AAC.1